MKEIYNTSFKKYINSYNPYLQKIDYLLDFILGQRESTEEWGEGQRGRERDTIPSRLHARHGVQLKVPSLDPKITT